MPDGPLVRAARAAEDRIAAIIGDAALGPIARTDTGGSRPLFIGLDFDYDEAEIVIAELLAGMRMGVVHGIDVFAAAHDTLRAALVIGALAQRCP